MAFYKPVILTAVMASAGILCHAQIAIQRQVGIQKTSVGTNRSIDDNMLITNELTGQLVSMEQYAQLVKDDSFAYHLVPNYNESGLPTTYTLRPATPEEHETHRFRDRDPAKQPKAGQPIAPFAMIGPDGKRYQSADLLGKVVVLSFWISLDKSFWDDKQAADFTDALQAYQSKTELVSLGVLNSEQPKEIGKNVPFVPIPNAYGFHNKYHITTVPTIVVIDKTGNVVANLQGAGIYDKLKQVLATVSK